MTGRLGYKFTPHFGVEGEATFGVDDDTTTVGGVPVKVDLNHQYGVYGVGFVPLNDKFDLFGRVGYATIDAKGRSGPITAGIDDDGVRVRRRCAIQFHAAVLACAPSTRVSKVRDDSANAWGLSGNVKF